MTFWVIAFQDLLCLAEHAICEGELRSIAHHHRREDAEHERWFLADIARFQPQPRLAELFGPEHQAGRDAAYSLISEVSHASADELRIVLLLVVESAGHVFFDRTARFIDRCRYTDELLYFSQHHLRLEHAHAVFEREAEARIEQIELPPALRANAVALVDRGYAAFGAIFEALHAEIAPLRTVPQASVCAS